MQQAPLQEQVGYASLGWRFTAVLVDTVVLFGVLIIVITVYVFVLASQGKIDPNDPAAAQELSRQLTSSDLPINFIFFAALFIYYVIFESVFSASVGKLVCGMRVTMRDGSRATGLAVVLRNLVRIPEAMFLYVPAGVSCLVSPERQRLGDRVARTVVLRRQPERGPIVYARPPQTPFGPPGSAAHPPQQGSPVPPAPPAAWPQPADATAEAVAQTDIPALAAALTRLKTAALALRGAHLAYLRFSERELAAGSDEHTGGYSEEYVSAWYTLTDAVASLNGARAELDGAAAAASQTPGQAISPHPDLVHMLRDLAPYFAAQSDAEVHEAFLSVARAEDPSP